MTSFRKGELYIFIGQPDAALWEIEQNNKLPLETYTYSSIEEVQQRTEFVFEPRALLFSLDPNIQEFEVPPSYKPSPNAIVFLVLTQQKEKLNKSATKAQSDYIKVVKLKNTNYLTRKHFKSWYQSLEEDEKKEVERFKSHPYRLDDLMNSTIEVTEHVNKEEDLYKGILDNLGTREGIARWVNTSKGELYRNFLTPELKRGGAYAVLAGRPNYEGKLKGTDLEWWEEFSPSLDYYRDEITLANGKAPELWFYYRQYALRFLDKTKDPSLFIYLFALWIYLASNHLVNKTGKGYKINQSKYRTYYNFNPSDKATELFNQLLK